MVPEDPNRPDTERRLLIALVLSTAVLLLSPYLLRYFSPEPVPVTSSEVREESPAEPPPPALPEEEAAEIAEVAPGQPTTATAREVRIQNQDLALVLNTRGLAFQSARLLNYVGESGEPLELFPQDVTSSGLRPFSLVVGDEELTRELEGIVYEMEGATSAEIVGPAEVRFIYRSERLQVERLLKISAKGYSLETENVLTVGGRRMPVALFLGPGIGPAATAESGGLMGGATDDFAMPRISYWTPEGVTHYAPDDIEQPQTLEVSARWAAYDSRFFTYLVLGPGSIRNLRLRLENRSNPVETGEEAVSTIVAEVAVEQAQPLTLLLGPKDLTVLQRVDESLGNLVDFGWFAILVRPLLFCLKVAYGLVHNYGWAIIIVTFFINLILLPIRYKQIISMKKMSALQPKLKTIQEKYKKLAKTDPKRQEMNKEIMALYQEHGVNPLGGCLPLLVQMPFLFAFYRMLASSIELRGAPFIWWIQDLSKADPYYITPIVMGVTMLAQQQMTPSTGDPAQRRMMMLMPIVFMFFFLSLSSGLVIYFLFSNVFGMLFQWALQKMGDEGKAATAQSKGKKTKRRKAQGVDR